MEEEEKSCRADSSREKLQNIVIIRTEEKEPFLIILTVDIYRRLREGKEWSWFQTVMPALLAMEGCKTL